MGSGQWAVYSYCYTVIFVIKTYMNKGYRGMHVKVTCQKCIKAFAVPKKIQCPPYCGTVRRVEESVETTLGEQADADSAHLLELIRDYLALISSVKVRG
jgi:hypothetical protein